MKSETKLFLGIIAATIILAVGAVFLFSKSPGQSSTKADDKLLIRSDSQKLASSSATVTMVEFSDFQCPACGAYYPLVKQLLAEFKTSLNFVYRNFPLQQHQNAHLAAQVAEAAGLQGKYWEMHDMLFEKQADWSESPKALDIFVNYASTLKLNIDEFKKDVDTSDIKNKVDRDVEDGVALGINATPTFFLAGEKLQNPGSAEEFRQLIKNAIEKAPIAQNPSEAYHVHANFKVYLNGVAFDFSPAKYQSNNGKDLNEDIHFHDGKGDLVHIHKLHATLGTLFTSLKMKFSKDCLVSDTDQSYCSGSQQTLKMYVNGKPNTQFDSYEPQDLDRILITFGNSTDASVPGQILKVADDACIYSLKCPERGKPPTEECVGGLGTGCKD